MNNIQGNTGQAYQEGQMQAKRIDETYMKNLHNATLHEEYIDKKLGLELEYYYLSTHLWIHNYFEAVIALYSEQLSKLSRTATTISVSKEIKEKYHIRYTSLQEPKNWLIENDALSLYLNAKSAYPDLIPWDDYLHALWALIHEASLCHQVYELLSEPLTPYSAYIYHQRLVGIYLYLTHLKSRNKFNLMTCYPEEESLNQKLESLCQSIITMLSDSNPNIVDHIPQQPTTLIEKARQYYQIRGSNGENNIFPTMLSYNEIEKWRSQLPEPSPLRHYSP